ncbi:MAG TPA: chemotaxis response regulator protein-glutamate methylesterase [Candidatus Omnitrophica bacterium]|nr:chemotaxis response regulator protein-glutamate methylesterase [Candidatus Omnitrophota bacterium]
MIKIAIADDSIFFTRVLKDTLEGAKDFSVIGEAANGKEAVELVKAKKPDVLILDCEMPVMNGLEALRVIMKECPVPVFMLSSLTEEGSAVTVKALEYGAFDFLLKPVNAQVTLDSVADELIHKIRFVVLKSRFGRLGKTGAGHARRVSSLKVPSRRVDIIAIGSSTGGVQAAIKIASKLRDGLAPIVWVQHMPPYFTKNFAQILDSVSTVRVREAQDGDFIERGHCYLARGGLQMRLKRSESGYRVQVGDACKISGHCPSCDVLFGSVAENFTDNALGVILTGMGNDGAVGLSRMHDRGAYIIGQDEASCVVYGMPKAAYKAGAVDIQLSLEDIADGISRVAGR